jgi:2-phospho-L-lactate/phosphoenolpyruvate guanylyltransferase
MDARVTAIVPLKALSEAKQRLAGTLSPHARRELAAWMFGRVAAACTGAASIGRVLAVAGDAAAARVAAEHGIEVILEPRRGLAHALAAADVAVAGDAATVVAAAVLALAEARDLDALCAAAGRGRVVVVAPTDDGGTGALLRQPPAVIRPAYGPGSADRHLALARAAGAVAVRLVRPGLAADVDDEAGLRRIQSQAGLTGLGVLDRT